MAQMVKNLPGNAGDVGLIPGSGRYPGGGNDNSLQYSSGESHGQRSLAGCIVHGVTESRTQLGNYQS